jgi:rubrerythrin
MDSVAAARVKLKTLAGMQASGGLFLSATVSTSGPDDWRQSAPVFLNSEFNRITKERTTPKDKRRLLRADLDDVLAVLKYEVTPGTQGLALFSDSGTEFKERIELPSRLSSSLVIEPSPYVRPVAEALCLLEPFVLARISRDESSLYLVDAWGVTSEEELAGPWLRSSDPETGEVSIKEYYAAARQDTLVDLHFKEVAASLAKLLEVSGAHRVALCAQHDIAKAFRRTLPVALATAVMAEMAFDAAASVGQMAANARQAMEQARHEETVRLANRIKEGLGRGGRGISGFSDVRGALERGQIQTLLVDRGYRVPGWRCGDCSWAGLSAVEQCPVCGGGVTQVVDVIGELVRLAILDSAQVEVGEGVAALNELGGVAGLLRYA